MRWDILEKFEFLKKGQFARAVKSFDGSEDFFLENYPGKPRVPEALLIEMIAQVGGVLFGFGFDFKKEVILAKVSGARFYRTVAPPAAFHIEAQIDSEREEGAWISGKVRSGGEIVAEASVLLASLEAIDARQKVVFDDAFLKHYDIYEVAKVSEGL